MTDIHVYMTFIEDFVIQDSRVNFNAFIFAEIFLSSAFLTLIKC